MDTLICLKILKRLREFYRLLWCFLFYTLKKDNRLKINGKIVYYKLLNLLLILNMKIFIMVLNSLRCLNISNTLILLIIK